MGGGGAGGPRVRVFRSGTGTGGGGGLGESLPHVHSRGLFGHVVRPFPMTLL